ncbi:hypothetical protein [Prevotella pallens]|uniref:hypothetical protein n=1 Tax=Prevotella pallens TaxID=60133 RepID=UPI00352FC89B
MLIPFCSKIEVAGQAYTRFWRKILPEVKCRCGDFPDKPSGTDLLKATSPVLPLRIKREQHPSSFHRISWSIGKEAKVQRS